MDPADPPSSSPGDSPAMRPVAGRSAGNALPDGTRLGEFEIRGVIGEGGFGIVYLAWDHTLHRQVALKEYMPLLLARRGRHHRVEPLAGTATETFALGLRSFINEAQLLASFDHRSLLKVLRFWEDHGTAYMAMPYYRGVTLKQALAALGAPPAEGWLMAQLAQLLDALDVMHRARCYHRDIAPDNILLLDDGTPLLLDFGAARRVISDATQALTTILKPGYAPVEQYGDMPSMKQGAWTDLYALASVVCYAITGQRPPDSIGRLLNDTMEPLAVRAAGRYSDRFLRAIDRALQVRPSDRTQSAAELCADLGLPPPSSEERRAGGIPTAPQALDSIPAGDDDDATRVPSLAPETFVPGRPASPTAAAGPTDPEATVAMGLPPRRPMAGATALQTRSPASDASASARLSPLALAAGLGALGALAGLGWWMVARTAAPAPAPTAVSSPASPATGPTPTVTSWPLPAATAPASASSPAAWPTLPASGTSVDDVPASPSAGAAAPGPAPESATEPEPATAPAPVPASPDGPRRVDVPPPASAGSTLPAPADGPPGPADGDVPDARPPTPTRSERPPPGPVAPARDRTAEPAANRAATPKLNPPDPRCTEIIARVSLGEELTAVERRVLQEDCRR